MKARYEKPRLVIQAIVLATLAGQYDDVSLVIHYDTGRCSL